MKIHISDDDKPNSDEENGKNGSTSQSAAKSTYYDTEFQKQLDEMPPELRNGYFHLFPHSIYSKPQMTSPSKSQVMSSNITVNEVSCLETKVDQQPELVETQPIVQQVVSLSVENKEKNKRKRKSEAAQVSLSGVIAKLNECFNEINSVWAQNPRNASLSLIPVEILKVRELVSDELEKFTESDD